MDGVLRKVGDAPCQVESPLIDAEVPNVMVDVDDSSIGKDSKDGSLSFRRRRSP